VRAFERRPEVVLAIYAHPDDADVAAGGSMAAWAKAGTHVHLLTICDGGKGSHDPGADADSLRGRRGTELAAAAEILGVSSVINLDQPDGEVTNDVALRRCLVGHVRRLRPDVVLAPDPTATFFSGVYVNHRDHRETGWAALDAVAPAAAMPLYFPEAGPAHEVADLLLSGTLEPDVVVDVSAGFEAKCAAVLAHASQMAGDPDGLRSILKGRAAQAGREIGVLHGEAFRRVAVAH
jgi:LmbE family N-acetylglucosaminyl deacetylase